MSTLIVTATPKPVGNFCDESPLFKSLLDDYATPVMGQERTENYLFSGAYQRKIQSADYDLLVFANNKRGLPEVYNTALYVHALVTHRHYRNVIFVHDDVAIQHPNFENIIQYQFDTGYSVVGLAGAVRAKIQKPALWHLMSDRAEWRGAVAHPDEDGRTWMTSFGPTPSRVLLLDGLFLAVDLAKITGNGIRFDEQFKFHHYDLDFCLTCNKAGLNLTTAPIWVTHNSPGLRSLEDPAFVASQDLFLQKWSK